MLLFHIGQIVQMEYFCNAIKIISNECLLDRKWFTRIDVNTVLQMRQPVMKWRDTFKFPYLDTVLEAQNCL